MIQYERYKESGVEWIGNIPHHWLIRKIKHNTYVKARIGWHGLKADEFTTQGVFCVTGTDFKNGKVDWSSCYKVSEERYNEDPYIQLREDDLLLTKDGTIGKTAIVKNLVGKATLNSGVFVIRGIKNEYLTDYLFYVLQTPVFTEFVNSTSKGSTIVHLYQDNFVNLPFPVPTIDEQNKIIQFLKRRCTRIDKCISQKQKLISLLNEEKTAVLNHAVTKGIDPDVPLKSTGIEWLGDVPTQWAVKKLKYVATMKSGFAFNSANFVQEGVQIIKIANLYQNQFCKERQPTYVPYSFLGEYFEWSVSNGNILMSMTGTLGKRDYGFAILLEDEEKFLMNQRVSSIKFHAAINKKFGLYILQSEYYQNHLFLLPTGTKQGNLSNEQVLSIPVAIPSLETQNEIIDFIEKSHRDINETISKIESEVELLIEYKMSLIYEVVTGKVKIETPIEEAIVV